MQPGGRTDKEVAAYRHVLAEADLDEDGNSFSLESQYEAFVRSGLPISAITSSGDQSLNGLVRVDADTIEQWRERQIVFDKLAGDSVDPRDKNPSRYSRLAGGTRSLYQDGKPAGTAEQHLYAARVGPESWEKFVDRLAAFSAADRLSTFPSRKLITRKTCLGTAGCHERPAGSSSRQAPTERAA